MGLLRPARLQSVCCRLRPSASAPRWGLGGDSPGRSASEPQGLAPAGPEGGGGLRSWFTFPRLFTKPAPRLFPLTCPVLSSGHVLVEISSTHQKLDESFKENVCEFFFSISAECILNFMLLNVSNLVWGFYFLSFAVQNVS